MITAAAAHSFCRGSEYQCPLSEFVRGHGFVVRYVHRSLALHGKYCKLSCRPQVRTHGRHAGRIRLHISWYGSGMTQGMYFRGKRRRKSKHRILTNAITIHKGRGVSSQTSGCISVSLFQVKAIDATTRRRIHDGRTSARTVHAMKEGERFKELG